MKGDESSKNVHEGETPMVDLQKKKLEGEDPQGPKQPKKKAKAKTKGAKGKGTPEELEADDAEGLTRPKKKAKVAKAADAKSANAEETLEVTPLKAKAAMGPKSKAGEVDVSPKSILHLLAAGPTTSAK